MGVVISWSVVEETLVAERSNQKLVFTNGCFDLLHIGHIRYLEEAKKQGDLLFLGLNSDASVKRLKGETRPLQFEADRAEILSKLLMVDYVCIFEQDTPLELIKKIRPDVLVKGGDWTVDQIVGAKEVLSWGGEVKSLQFVQGKSTTRIVNKIAKL